MADRTVGEPCHRPSKLSNECVRSPGGACYAGYNRVPMQDTAPDAQLQRWQARPDSYTVSVASVQQRIATGGDSLPSDLQVLRSGNFIGGSPGNTPRPR